MLNYTGNYYKVIKGPTQVTLVLKHLNVSLEPSAIQMEISLNETEILVSMLPKMYVMNSPVYTYVSGQWPI